MTFLSEHEWIIPVLLFWDGVAILIVATSLFSEGTEEDDGN